MVQFDYKTPKDNSWKVEMYPEWWNWYQRYGKRWGWITWLASKRNDERLTVLGQQIDKVKLKCVPGMIISLLLCSQDTLFVESQLFLHKSKNRTKLRKRRRDIWNKCKDNSRLQTFRTKRVWRIAAYWLMREMMGKKVLYPKFFLLSEELSGGACKAEEEILFVR